MVEQILLKAKTSRRRFLRDAALVGASTSALSLKEFGSEPLEKDPREPKKPNIIIFVADQMRWDFIGAFGLNPTVRTPNLDRIARRGTAFTTAVTNQPLCSPSRSCMLTGLYSTKSGMWGNPPAPNAKLDKEVPTLATILRANGYTANFIGKWHLAPIEQGNHRTTEYVQPEDRGGFLDVWEGANLLASNSTPYSGTVWDQDGKTISWKDEYRSDFLTDRAVRFLKSEQKKPFLLFISQQEPHFQGGGIGVVAPKGYADRYEDYFVPPDLLHLPGNWEKELPSYYGCVEKIDESVGKILKTLEDQGEIDNTIFLFTSDHGCHFHTREVEDKRSPHDSSIRVPLLVQGPGFDSSLALQEIVGNIHLTPTLLDGAGVHIPESMQGKSLLPLIHDAKARGTWQNVELIQISESMLGRAIRTKEWTYCVIDPNSNAEKISSSMHYEEHQMYNNFGDPAQLVSLAGRKPYWAVADNLRKELLDRIEASGEARPTIVPSHIYP